MDSAIVIRALGALAQEHRLAAFRLLVQAGEDGMPAGAIAEKLGVVASSMSFHLAALANAGTLLAFMAVSLCLLVLRRRAPNFRRPFRTKGAWIIAPAAILGCAYLFLNLPLHTQLFVEPSPAPTKWALSRLGRCGAALRLPITPLTPAGQAAVAFDWWDRSTWAAALNGASALYVIAPRADGDAGPVMIDFVREAIVSGVRRVVLQSGSPVPPGAPGTGKVHAWLADNAGDANVGWAVLRPSWFMQNFT